LKIKKQQQQTKKKHVEFSVLFVKNSYKFSIRHEENHSKKTKKLKRAVKYKSNGANKGETWTDIRQQ